MKVFKSILLLALVFFMAFGIEFKFHLLQSLNSWGIDWAMGENHQTVRMSTHVADTFYAVLATSLLFASMVAFPVSLYLWQRGVNKRPKASAWKGALLGLLVFLCGALLVSLWYLKHIHLVASLIQTDSIMMDTPKSLLALVSKQWQTGVFLLVVVWLLKNFWKKYYARAS